jgi:transcriptional regulator with PAS, ATPase and Fis domain
VAHRGTVFLDEIGDMEVQVQPKLLKVLEDKRFRRLGSVEDRCIDVRLVSATHQDLTRFVREQRFRQDLYFRISTIPLSMPPLRSRPEDIALVARHLLEGIGAEVGRLGVRLAADAERALEGYAWPGNIRELRNVLERAVLLSERDTITARDLRFETGAAPAAIDTTLTLEALERRYIEQVLAEEGGNVVRAAERLAVPKSTLYQRIKKHQLARPG